MSRWVMVARVPNPKEPKGEREKLFAVAKSKAAKRNIKLSKKEFYRGLELYKAQHGVYPRKQDLLIKKASVPEKVGVLVGVGELSRIDYETNKRSKKTSPNTRTIYYHETDGNQLAVDVWHKKPHLIGKMRLLKNDGMLHG